MSTLSKQQIKKDLCYAVSGYILNRNILSTGFNVDNAYLQNDSIDELAELFILNASIDQNNPESIYTINKYLRYPLTEMTALSGNTQYPGLEKIKLANNYQLDMPLGNVISKRKTIRKFSGDYVPFNYISTIVRNAQGITHSNHDCSYERKQRACPSGGGLYPVKIYLYAHKVRNLARGIYVYCPIQDTLIVIEKSTLKLDSLLQQHSMNELPNIQDCAFMLFFTVESWKSISKYGSSGLKFALIELGAIAEHAHLAATCLGLGSCPYASFKNKDVNQLLNIDGDYESFQHAILFGIHSEI